MVSVLITQTDGDRIVETGPKSIYARFESVEVLAVAIQPEGLEGRVAKGTGIDKMLRVERVFAVFARRDDQVHVIVADAVSIQAFQDRKKDQLTGP